MARSLTPGLGKAQLPRETIKWGGKQTSIVKYDEEMAIEILLRVENGETLREICSPGSGYCSPAAFRRWAIERPELQKAFNEARRRSAAALEEEALEDARALREDPQTAVDVSASRTLIEQLRWSAERRAPEEFAPRPAQSIVVPVQINTALDLGQPDAPKTTQTTNVYEVKGEVIGEKPPPVPKLELKPRNPEYETDTSKRKAPKWMGKRRAVAPEHPFADGGQPEQAPVDGGVGAGREATGEAPAGDRVPTTEDVQ